MEKQYKVFNRREFLALAGGVLAGCKVPEMGQTGLGFDNRAYNYLVRKFKRKGLFNLDSPLFDFKDEEIKEAYERASAQRGLVIDRDFTCSAKIESEVERHLNMYTDRNLILFSGAAFHIYPAVNALENKFDTDYISMTPRKLTFNDVIWHNKFLDYKTMDEEMEEARKTLEIQMRRANGVCAELGYGNLLWFAGKNNGYNHRENIAVGIEETGLHDVYPNYTKETYEILGKFVDKFKPKTVLYLKENGFFNPDKNRDEFLEKSFRLGIQVENKGF